MSENFDIAETNNEDYAWINEGFVEFHGTIGCEQRLSGMYGGDWYVTREVRHRNDVENERIYFKEYKFIKADR